MTLDNTVRTDLVRIVIAISFIACYAYSTGATAQNVYKCGTTYSEMPCPDGQRIEVKDPRTAEQTKQARVATEKNRTQAQVLEKTRAAEVAAVQKQERATAKAQAKTKNKSVETNKASKIKASKKKTPEYFTASAEKPPKGAKP